MPAKRKSAKKQNKKDYSSSELSKFQPRTLLYKVHTIGRDDVDEQRAEEAFDHQERVFGDKGALIPPYAFESLAFLLENSNSLRQNIEAYITNIDSFGHRFEPSLSIEGKDAEKMVAEAIFIEKLTEAENAQELAGESMDLIDDDKLEATPDEIKARLKKLRGLARREKAKLTQFFDFINVEDSFVKIRRKTRQDRELMGNAFWEILRNGNGQTASVSHVPAIHVRLLPKDKKATRVHFRTKLTPITFQKEHRWIKFRRFVQILPQSGIGAMHTNSSHTYFKQYGDLRTMSAETGTYYESVEAMLLKEADARTATEMMHFKVHSSNSPYGVPRWIGNLISVLGSRQAEEVNFLYFENKAVPPLALLVSGGRLAKGVVSKIQDMIENHLKGRRNFHKILIIEAETSRARGVTENNGRVQLELKPLTSAQQSDQLFQAYDENNIAKVSAAFRVPKILRGETKDFNRATADAAKIFAEEQVFQPERDDFDSDMNRQLMADLMIRFFTFKSNAPITRDPTKMTKNITELVKASVLTPGEGRLLAEDVFNREFAIINEPWAKQPIEVTKAGFVPEDSGEMFTRTAEEKTLQKRADGARATAQELLKELQDMGFLGKDATVEQLKGVLGRLLLAKQPATKADGEADEDQTVTIEISSKEMADLVERE